MALGCWLLQLCGDGDGDGDGSDGGSDGGWGIVVSHITCICENK